MIIQVIKKPVSYGSHAQRNARRLTSGYIHQDITVFYSEWKRVNKIFKLRRQTLYEKITNHSYLCHF